MSLEEIIAKKDFSGFYNQIADADTTDQIVRKFSIASTKSISSISDANIALEWITYSMRQNILLNQLKYLMHDQELLKTYYKMSAFVLDKSFVDDFLNYIQAYEKRDFSMLSKVKRNFFNINSRPMNMQPNHKGLIKKATKNIKIESTHPNSKNSIRKSTANSPPSSLNAHFPLIESNLSLSPNSSHASSATNSSVSSVVTKPTDEVIQMNNSIVEYAVNELNQLQLKRHAKSHRRMCSVPNIQVNLAKKNSMTVNYSSAMAGNGQSFNSNNSFKNSLNGAELKMSTSLLDTSDSSEQQKPSSNSITNETPTLSNDQHQNELEIFQCSPPSSPTLTEYESSLELPDIYKQTSVFDFIHSQQINLECSQLDKENSHFIIADISIGAFELIKTEELANLDDEHQIEFKPLPKPIVSRPRAVSSGIKINNSLSTRIKKARNQNFDSPADLASPNSTAYLEDFGTSSMAQSMDQEIIMGSGFTSPDSRVNTDILSMSSVGGISKLEYQIPSNSVTPTRKLSAAQSLDSLNSATDDEEMDKLETITKYESSSDLREETTSSITNQDDSERLLFLRQKWLMAARKIVVTQNMAKIKKNPTKEEILDVPRISDDRTSINTEISETISCEQSKQVSRRARRFSWEEIINLDTAEHISTRLIERLIDAKTFAMKHRGNNQPVSCPNLRQFECVVQSFEYYEFMQIYYELRASGQLAKYLSLASRRNSSKQSNNMQKYKSSSTIKVKTAAVAAAAAVSINFAATEQQQEKAEDLKSISSGQSSFNNENGKKNLIRQISVSIHNNNPSRKSTNSIENIISSKRDSLASNSTLVGSNMHNTLNARIIGDENWAPVRDQLILNQTPKSKRLDQMMQQNFRCADCGFQVRREKMKSFNYCEYFCKYFCRCCHINNHSYIPAYVINSNDFRIKYEVSKKAKNFLEKIYTEPVITLESLNPVLFERASTLAKIKRLRLRLYTCRSYINSCRFATELKRLLYGQFDDFIINDQHVYSIETLFKIKKTTYYDDLKNIVSQIMEHIRKCELCSQQGYLCGLCSDNELLYPFDLEKVEKCVNCLACYHKSCFKKPELCPRCIRKRNRIQSINTGSPSVSNTSS